MSKPNPDPFQSLFFSPHALYQGCFFVEQAFGLVATSPNPLRVCMIQLVESGREALSCGMDTSPSASNEPGPEKSARETNFKTVAFDVLLVFLATAVGGFFFGAFLSAMRLTANVLMLGIALSNLLSATAAFIVIAWRTPQRRWRHLLIVALVSWALSIFNVFVFHFSLAQWLFGLFFLLIPMAIGGAVATLMRDE
jgi:hypothetical protein